MIASPKDINFMLEQDKKHRDVFNEHLRSGALRDQEVHKALYLWGIDYYHQNPHLLFPSGFDEVRYIRGKTNVLKFIGDPFINEAFILGEEFAFFRWEKSGAWYLLHESPYMGGEFRFICQHDARKGLDIPFNYVLNTLKKAINTPLSKCCSIITPCLWTPDSQKNENIFLKEAIQHILRELIDQHLTLSELNWKEFECIVAEILRDRGVMIHRVVNRPQGGKDLIVRGELIPGEPMYMAVEIKHTDKVGVREVRSALKATEEYPSLLFVTSGRFTAGVINEKRRQSNQLRLLLKDGAALGDMIRKYGISKGWIK